MTLSILNKAFLLALFPFFFLLSYLYTGSDLQPFTFFMFIFTFITIVFSFFHLKQLPGYYFPFFIFPFTVVILLSCFSFSWYQSGYNSNLFSIVIISLIITAGWFLVLDTVKFKKLPQVPILDADVIFYSFLALFIILKIYIINKTGIRLESLIEGSRVDGKEFVIPGISGLVALLQWSLLILFPFINRKKKVIAFMCILLFAFLSAKRGDLVRLLMFVGVYFYILNKGNISRRSVIIVTLCIVFFGFGFALLGDIRQAQYDTGFSIVSTLGSYYNSSSLSWFFGYTGFNFEVLGRIPVSNEVNLPMSVIIPVYRSGIDEGELLSYYKELSQYRVSGFNASTFLGPMVHDMGQFFWMELILFLCIISLIISLAKMCDSIGSEIMILSLVALLPFGNFLLSPQFMFAIIFSSFLTLFLKRKSK